MKYIRTKDGRIIDCVKLKNEAKKHILQNEDDYKLAYVLSSKTYDTDLGWQRRVDKQSDTIEELCDEFYAIPLCDADIEIAGIPIHIKKGKHYFVHKEEIEKFIPSVKIKTSELYGAIWTNKGLIYVAKMKGVLPSGEIDWELL